jgi:hypothetical protein
VTRSPRVVSDVFVVRTWHERGLDGEVQWRASITHVSTGDRCYFTSYAELGSFLDRWRKRAG